MPVGVTLPVAACTVATRLMVCPGNALGLFEAIDVVVSGRLTVWLSADDEPTPKVASPLYSATIVWLRSMRSPARVKPVTLVSLRV